MIVPEQLSVVVGAVAVALHSPVRVDNIGIAGLMVSITVTVAVQLLLLPEPSVTVRVTVFMPRLLQLKDVLLRERVGVPQLSLDPLLT